MSTTIPTTNVQLTWDATSQRWHCIGHWTENNLAPLIHPKTFKKRKPSLSTGLITVVGNELKDLDSAGCLLLHQLVLREQTLGHDVRLEGFTDKHLQWFERLKKDMGKTLKNPEKPAFLERLGRQTVAAFHTVLAFFNFIGETASRATQQIKRPKTWRLRETMLIIQQVGVYALPIIGLLSGLVGVVLTYQMGLQLRTYGANIFIVDLLGLAVLREFAPLLAAILVTGRSGSAFTAQLGIMKINEETDALRTMGVSPSEFLVLPRLLGMTLAMPLLVMWANIFGILGGAIMAKAMLSISIYDFFDRFNDVIDLASLFIGLGKAPVFGMLIASVGCFQGMQVSGSAASVGQKTTQSVVQSLFLIIVADAIFSIVFSALNI